MNNTQEEQKTGLGFVEAHEEQEAINFVNEKLGFEAPRPCGYQMVIKIFVRDEELKEITNDKGEKITLYLPESVRTEDKYRSCTGLVMAQGPDCYQGERFEKSGPWCRVGDWVVYPRHEGHQVNYKNVPIHIINDDRILMVIKDPTDVRRD